jgi:hypothetical protein
MVQTICAARASSVLRDGGSRRGGSEGKYELGTGGEEEGESGTTGEKEGESGTTGGAGLGDATTETESETSFSRSMVGRCSVGDSAGETGIEV